MFESWDWNLTLWHFSLEQLVLALSIFVLVVLFSQGFVRVVLKRLVARTQTAVDDTMFIALKSPVQFAFLVIAFYLATRVLHLPADIDDILIPLIRSLAVFAIFWALYAGIEPLSFVIDKVTIAFGAELTHDLKSMFTQGLKLLIFAIGLAAFLNEWGVNVLGIFAGLSIGGVAVAFAAKESIANIFCALTIIFDDMFKPGDWIMTPDVEGIVETIGSRSTQIRTFEKAVVIVPNATLVNSAVTNWSRVTNRRIKMRLALEYRTSREQIMTITQRIQDYLRAHPAIETDSSKASLLTNLVEFNQSSIDIMLYYFTKTTNWYEWLRTREENMLAVMKIIEEEGAAFAFPSQQIYVEKLPSQLPKLL